MAMFADTAAYKEHIIDNCDHVFTGKWMELLEDANTSASNAEKAGLGRRHGERRTAATDARNDARLPVHTMRLINEGRLARAMDKLRSAFHPAAAPDGQSLLSEMRAKHPPAKAPIPPPPDDLPRLSLSYTAFLAAVHSLEDG
jgi:hypothetical protein